MKKIILITIIVFLLSLALVGTVFAQGRVAVVKGQVTAFDGITITIESVKDGTVTVTLPDGFVNSSIGTGDTVMAKGTWQSPGSLKADSVRVLGSGKGQGKPENPGIAGSAFCSEDKQGTLHPLADKLADKFDITSQWVNDNYCAGNSIGAIMLALKTVKLQEATAGLTGSELETAANELLLRRTEGEGWGKIWQDLKLIGSEEEVKTPPGQLKKNK